MARPSKLTDKQKQEIVRRSLEGETIRELAKSFKVGVSTVHSVVSERVPVQKELAESLAYVENKIGALSILEQNTIRNYADRLKSISNHLTSAAEYGARTSHKLAGIANAQVEMIDDTNIQDNTKVLQNVAALTRMANESSVIAMGLLNANKEQVTRLSEPERDKVKSLDEFYKDLGSSNAG